MTTSLPSPPPELRPLAQVVGLEGLFRLLEWRGGTRLPVPIRPAGSTIAAALGETTAAALVEHWGGLTLKVPIARLWRVQVHHAHGLSYAEIATRVGLTEAGVWRMLRSSGLTGDAAARRSTVRATRSSRTTDEPGAGARSGAASETFTAPTQLDILAWLGEDR